MWANYGKRTATVGTASDNPAAQLMIQEAIATGSIDAVKATVGELNAAAQAAAEAAAAFGL